MNCIFLVEAVYHSRESVMGCLTVPMGKMSKCVFSLPIRLKLMLCFTEKTPPKLEDDSDYECTNGSSMSQVLVDDLVPDCPLQDDEDKYQSFLANESRPDFFTDRLLCKEPDATTCEKNYRGVCYSRHLHCIHEVIILRKAQIMTVRTETCRNGAHLRDCMMHSCPSYFKCPSAYCIPVYAVCNGNVDCPNGEDEDNCQSMSCPGFLLCRYDKVCVHPHDVWSGGVKCPVSIDDKALRDIGPCPGHCECLGNGIRCNNAKKLNLPKLSTSMRILLMNNTQFTLDNLQWRGNLIALLHLQLSFCNISSIENKHFRSLQFLQYLNLRHNVISSLPIGIFQTLSDVKYIDLGRNIISELRPGIFRGVNALQLLKLDFNQLTFIAPCTFNELEKLTALNLSNNYLTELGDNIFCHMELSIKELYLGGNRLDHVEKRILKSHMWFLTHLDI